MDLLTAPARSPGLRFRLFGFPVEVQWTFVLIPVLFGLSVGPEWALILAGVLFVSILTHELGHAFAARRLGGQPRVVIYALGGLTSYAPAESPTRAQSIGVSLAGPGAGFALGLLALAVAAGLGVAPLDVAFDDAVADHVLALLVFVNLAWGALNLLPVLPLDGGQVMADLLPGDPATRRVRAAAVSVVVASLIAVLAWQAGFVFGAVLLGVFAFQSLSVLAESRRRRRESSLAEDAEEALRRLRGGDTAALAELEVLLARADDPGLSEQLAVLLVEIYASTGRPAEARRVLRDAPINLHPAWYGLVALAEGDATGLVQVDDAFRNDPSPSSARCLAIAHLRAGRGDELPAVLASAPMLSPMTVSAAAAAARGQGRADLAAIIEQVGSPQGGSP